MDNQAFSSTVKLLLFIMALCIGFILPSDRVGAESLNISDIDRRAVQKLLTREEKAWLSKHKTIPILFISGYIEFLESINTLKQKDPNIDHLSKPCKNVDYLTCINKLLAGLNA